MDSKNIEIFNSIANTLENGFLFLIGGFRSISSYISQHIDLFRIIDNVWLDFALLLGILFVMYKLCNVFASFLINGVLLFLFFIIIIAFMKNFLI